MTSHAKRPDTVLFMENKIFNCEIHGYLTGEQIRVVIIKKREYKRCRLCQREKDKKHAKTYRNKNKSYYAKKKKEHYEKKPYMQIARNQEYRRRKQMNFKPK